MTSGTDSRTCESCGSPLLDDEPSCWRCGHHPGAELGASPRRPGGVTALAVLNGVVGLSAFATAGWAILSGGLPWIGFFAALYGVVRWAAAVALWDLRPQGRTLQRIFSFTELPLLPVGTVLSILVLLYFRKPAIEALFARGTDPPARPVPLASDRGDETILAVVAVGFGVAVLLGTGLFLAVALGLVDDSSDELLAQLPSCTEAEGVSEETTELWRLPMDEAPQTPDPAFREAVEIDTAEKVEGRASWTITPSQPTAVPLGSFALDGYRLGEPFDGRTVFVRAKIRAEGERADEVQLFSRISGSDPMSVGPRSVPPADEERPWRDYELTYVASPDDRGGTHDLHVFVPEGTTAWIDDVRILRGPRFQGVGWSERLVVERVRRPATGVEELLAHLVAEEGEDLEEAREGREHPLLLAFSGRPAGAEPPERVQRCLTEMLLAYETTPHRPLHVSVWRRLIGAEKISGRVIYWRPTILGFRQPDYLDRLVHHSPDRALVATYGRDVLPHLLAHGGELLGLPGSSATGQRESPGFAILAEMDAHYEARGFLEMTADLLSGVDDGRWEIADGERTELRELLEAHFRLYGDEESAVPFAHIKRDLLVSTLERLGSDAAPDEEASPPPAKD